MAGEVNFINGINIASGGNLVLNSLLTELVNQNNFMQDVASINSELYIRDTKALSLDQKFSAYTGAVELDKLTEGGVKAEQDRAKTPDKGFLINEFGGKLTVSYLMRKWIEGSETITGADASVKQGWADFMQNGTFLFNGAKLNYAIESINLLYKGLSAVSVTYGPGSPTPKGKALFTTNHPVRNNTLTFRNVLTTANQVFSSAALQDALNIQKTQLKLDNGYRTKLPRGAFEIWTSRANAINVRGVLNTAGSNAGIFSGTGTNANMLNTFSFQGNMVTLKEIPLLGDTDKYGNVIGSDTAWFVVNPDTLQEIQGLRNVKLYDPQVKNYINDETDGMIADIRLGFAVDHYGAEAAIVGSLGTV